MARVHVPDGFLDLTTSVSTAVVATGAVSLALQRAGQEVREVSAPLAGLTAAFVFGAQMVNFPVGAGTSGHLIGGALAMVLVGPWTAVLCMTVVLLVQGLLFADGGLTALGTNVLLMGVVSVLCGALVLRGALAVLPRRPTSVVPAAALAALVSVPVAALAFSALFAVGGTAPIPLGALVAAMVGWHLVIGVGEAVITAAVVGAVVATRPDLVHAARHLRPDLVLVGADGSRSTVPADASRSRDDAGTAVTGTTRRPFAVGLAVTAVVAGLVSLAASASPDGLQFVGSSLGFGDRARASAAAGSPLADYAVAGVTSPLLSGALAGLLGVALTLAVGSLLALTSRRVGASRDAAPAPQRSAAVR